MTTEPIAAALSPCSALAGNALHHVCMTDWFLVLQLEKLSLITAAPGTLQEFLNTVSATLACLSCRDCTMGMRAQTGRLV